MMMQYTNCKVKAHKMQACLTDYKRLYHQPFYAVQKSKIQ